MNILFLSQWFQPEPCFKGLPFAKALREKGHHVEILTGFPNYPGGKVYPNYRVRLYQREMLDGIQVNRVPLYPSHDKSALRRIINYLSFAVSAFFLGPWLIRRPDIIYVCNLVTLSPVAFLLRFFFGSKIIIDVLDLWPESVISSNMLNNKAALYVLNNICKFVYRKADKLVVPSPGIKYALIGRGVPPEKIEVIYNWCDESCIVTDASPSDSAKRLEFAGKFVVLFAGTMGTAQGLDTLLDCAAGCKEALPGVQFALIGGGIERPRLQQRAEEMRLDNVTFLPLRSMDTMGAIFALADALLVHLKDDPLFRITIPSKTQAYLYAGKPIIMAMRGDAANLVCEAGVGIVCEPDNPQEMMNAIKTLYDMPEIERRKMGESGRDFYLRHLSFNEGVNRFERLFLSCVT